MFSLYEINFKQLLWKFIPIKLSMIDSAMKFTLNYFPCVITIIPYIVNNFSIYCINKYEYLLITLLPPPLLYASTSRPGLVAVVLGPPLSLSREHSHTNFTLLRTPSSVECLYSPQPLPKPITRPRSEFSFSAAFSRWRHMLC